MTIAPVQSKTRIRMAIILGALCAWYLSHVQRFVLGGDNAEFVLLASKEGVAHPPGYPLYTALLRVAGAATSLLPPTRAGLLSVVLSLAALVFLYHSVRRYDVSRWSSLLATAAAAVAPLFVTLATQAEVFALHALLVCAVLFVTAPHTEQGTQRWALPFLFGCGFAHHHTLVWMLPLALVVYGRAVSSASSRPLALLQGVALFLIPVCSYLFLSTHVEASTQNQLPVLADVSTLYGLMEFVLRRQYGTLSLSSLGGGSSALFEVRELLLGLVHNLTLLGLALAGYGFYVKRHWLLLIVWLACGVGFVSLGGLPAHGAAREVMGRFYLMPLLVMIPFIGLALDAIALRILSPIWIFVLLMTTMSTGVEVEKHHGPLIEQSLIAQLTAAPKDALLFSQDDTSAFGFVYLQQVEELRTDVVPVGIGYLRSPRYRQMLARRLGHPVPPDVLELMALEAKRRRSVFSFQPQASVVPVVTPVAGAWLVGEPAPSVLDSETETLALLGDVLLDEQLDTRRDRWSFLAVDNCAKQLLWLSNGFENHGREDLAYLYGRWAETLSDPSMHQP